MLLRRAKNRIKRLKSVIESAHPGQLIDECLWCEFNENRHNGYCLAFTPDGKVK